MCMISDLRDRINHYPLDMLACGVRAVRALAASSEGTQAINGQQVQEGDRDGRGSRIR